MSVIQERSDRVLVQVEIQDQQSNIVANSKIILPHKFKDFMKNKQDAFSFFMLNKQSRIYFEDQDLNIYFKDMDDYQRMKLQPFIVTGLVNILIMRYLYANNLIFRFTQKTYRSKAIPRFMIKYYLIPGFVTYLTDKFIFRPHYYEKASQIIGKYEEKIPELERIFNEIINTKNTVVLQKDLHIL